jgi:hypothetical protein
MTQCATLRTGGLYIYIFCIGDITDISSSFFLRFIYYLKKEPDFLRIQNQRNSFSRRGNAASIRGTFPDFTLFSEIFVGRYGKKKNVMYLSCFIICHFVLYIKKLLLCINKFIYIFEKDR